jgi:thiol-disulfide isomerase/thioredoxin
MLGPPRGRHVKERVPLARAAKGRLNSMAKPMYRETSDEYAEDNDGYYEEEGYDYLEEEETQEVTVGLFSTPARAAAVIGSFVLLIAIMSVVIWVLSTRPEPGPTPPGSVKVPVITNPNPGGEGQAPVKGSFAPDFQWTDPQTGKVKSISSLKGKPVFINFWGTWCPPCRAEMPEMQRLYNQYNRQMEFVGVSMGPRDSASLVESFVNAAGYNWLFVQDDTYDVATRYQVMAVPSSYFVGPDGIIKAIHVGGMNGPQMEGYLAQVR